MPNDPIDLLGDLPDWPGNTPPRNRGGKAPAPATDTLNGARSKFYIVNGVNVEMFTIGEVARAINRRPATIRMWEHKGWIPRVAFRTSAPTRGQLPNRQPKGRRLYSRKQVEFLKDCIERFSLDDKNSPHWEAFKDYAVTHWPKI